MDFVISLTSQAEYTDRIDLETRAVNTSILIQ
jgi:hypothetical protein